jgi:hypothetical protein
MTTMLFESAARSLITRIAAIGDRVRGDTVPVVILCPAKIDL